MLTDTPMPAQELICDFAAGLESAGDFDQAMDLLLDAARKIGFDMVDYAYLPVCRSRDGGWVPPPVQTRNFPPGWDAQWHRHSMHDPYYHACFEDGLWLDWTQVQQRRELSGAERDCLNYLADQQMHAGITIPIRMPAGQLAFVSGIGGRGLRADGGFDAQMPRSLFLVAHYFHNTTSQKRMRRAAHPEAALSERECECLAWAARGKTAEDTGIILDRSVETVRVHLKHAIAKLGAVNCAHAVAKAVFLGFIEP